MDFENKGKKVSYRLVKVVKTKWIVPGRKKVQNFWKWFRDEFHTTNMNRLSKRNLSVKLLVKIIQPIHISINKYTDYINYSSDKIKD